MLNTGVKSRKIEVSKEKHSFSPVEYSAAKHPFCRVCQKGQIEHSTAGRLRVLRFIMYTRGEVIGMYEISKEKFGPFVAGLRKEKGLTQKQLADALYVSDKAVSKWERGLSLPDTGLLLPLSQQLGVTVTELLLCEKAKDETPLPRSQVDDLVGIFAQAKEKPLRSWRVKSRWPLFFLLALFAGSLGSILLLNHLDAPELFPALLTMQILAAVFGAYFCFFAPVKLPPLYDAYPISFYSDGPFRMNLPGVQFSNRNWPGILRGARISCCVLLAVLPLAAGLLLPFLPGPAGMCVLLAVFLFLLFLPIYLGARK